MSRWSRTTRRLLGLALLTAFVTGVGGANDAVPPSGGVPDLPRPARTENRIDFSFDQVEVGTFVKLIGEITGRRFVLGDGVQGRITVVSPRVSREEVYPLFVSVLESVGCSIVQDGDVARIVALPQRDAPIAPVIGADETPPPNGVYTKIFRLEHVSAAELHKALQAQVGGGKAGAIAAIEETNHLLVTDTADTIRRVAKIVEEIDRPGLARVTEVVPLKFAGADDLAEELNLALMETESRAERLKRRLPQVGQTVGAGRQSAFVVPSPHANSLILVGTTSQIADLKRLIADMDVDAPSGQGRLNAIFLKYIEAEEAAESLSALLEDSAKKEGAATGGRRIAIQPNPANNALLVDASPGDFQVVKELVDQLDRAAEQVQITVLILEHSLSDDFTLGVEMAAVDMPSEPGDLAVQGGSLFSEGADSLLNMVQSGLFPRGISVGVAHGTRVDNEGKIVTGYPGIINVDALKRDGRFKIVLETVLGAENNREASVDIVNDIPILSSTVQGSGADRDFIQNLDRTDVGVKLMMTPQIIPGGEVRMQLSPRIEAVVDPGPSGTQFAPTIARREVSTTVTVPDGRTIVIAGLTREDLTEVKQRVPLLGSIPFLGWLFRHSTQQREKTNLLIMVTPRIIPNMDVAEEIRQEWNEKVKVGDEEPE